MQCVTENNLYTVWEKIDFRIWLHVTLQCNISLRRPGSKMWSCHYGKSSDSHRADSGSILILTLASVNPIHSCLPTEFRANDESVDGWMGGGGWKGRTEVGAGLPKGINPCRRNEYRVRWLHTSVLRLSLRSTNLSEDSGNYTYHHPS